MAWHGMGMWTGPDLRVHPVPSRHANAVTGAVAKMAPDPFGWGNLNLDGDLHRFLQHLRRFPPLLLPFRRRKQTETTGHSLADRPPAERLKKKALNPGF